MPGIFWGLKVLVRCFWRVGNLKLRWTPLSWILQVHPWGLDKMLISITGDSQDFEIIPRDLWLLLTPEVRD